MKYKQYYKYAYRINKLILNDVGLKSGDIDISN